MNTDEQIVEYLKRTRDIPEERWPAFWYGFTTTGSSREEYHWLRVVNLGTGEFPKNLLQRRVQVWLSSNPRFAQKGTAFYDSGTQYYIRFDDGEFDSYDKRSVIEVDEDYYKYHTYDKPAT